MLQPDTEYTVTINGVLDAQMNEIAPDSQISFRSWVVTQGFAKEEFWYNIGGGVLVSDLTNNAAYPNSPSQVRYADLLESPNNLADNYGVKISGYIVPDVSGAHNSYMSADDGASFYLSTDSTPANLQLLAFEPVWNRFPRLAGHPPPQRGRA